MGIYAFTVEILGVGDKKEIIIKSSSLDGLKIDADLVHINNLTLQFIEKEAEYRCAISILTGKSVLENCHIIGGVITNDSTEIIIRKCNIYKGLFGVVFLSKSSKSIL